MNAHRLALLLLAAFVAGLGFGRAGAGADPGAAQPAAKPGESPAPAARPLRIMVIGAHPDDCEFRAGGAAALWSALGHEVKFVSATNGDVGHWRISGAELAQRRLEEVQRAARILRTVSEVLDIHDGELVPSLENRKTFTRLIRLWKSDVVISHRPNDYHPDHRYTGVLVQDSAYMVTVPMFCPDAPYLRDNPVYLYCEDDFERPEPFRPDVVVSIDPVVERKVDALVGMESQFVEGGAHGYLTGLPRSDAEREARRKTARDELLRRFAATADTYRDKLVELYGPQAGAQVRYAEAFEVCQYGRRPRSEELRKLFPFLPQDVSQ